MGIRASTNDTEKSNLSDKNIRYLDRVLLVYYNSQINSDKDELAFEDNLRRLTTSFIRFDHLNLLKQWLQVQSDHENILLIIKDNLEKKIAFEILQLKSNISIYIIPIGFHHHQTVTVSHIQIHLVTSEPEEFINELSEKISSIENLLNGQSIEIYQNRPSNSSIRDIDQIKSISNVKLMEILLSSTYLVNEPSPRELIKYLRESYPNDRYTLQSISLFEQSYSPSDAIQWLIGQTPLSKIVTKALHDHEIAILFDLRFYFRDLYNQMKSKHLSEITVYHKQIFSKNQFESIRKNNQNYLIFNNFLLAHRDLPKYSPTKFEDTEYETVLFQIDGRYVDETTLFTYTNANENEVLFLCGSFFQIKSITSNSNSIWKIHLLLTSHRQIALLNESKDPLLLIPLLDQTDSTEKLRMFCDKLLREYPANHPSTLFIQDQLDRIYQHQPSI